MIDVLGALMGIDIQASTRPEGSTDIPEGVEVPPLNPGTSSPPPPKPTQPPAPAPAPAAGDVEMEDDDEEAQAKKAVEPAIGAVEREFMMIAMDVREKARRFERNPRNAIALGHVLGEAQGISTRRRY